MLLAGAQVRREANVVVDYEVAESTSPGLGPRHALTIDDDGRKWVQDLVASHVQVPVIQRLHADLTLPERLGERDASLAESQAECDLTSKYWFQLIRRCRCRKICKSGLPCSSRVRASEGYRDGYRP